MSSLSKSESKDQRVVQEGAQYFASPESMLALPGGINVGDRSKLKVTIQPSTTPVVSGSANQIDYSNVFSSMASSIGNALGLTNQLASGLLEQTKLQSQNYDKSTQGIVDLGASMVGSVTSALAANAAAQQEAQVSSETGEVDLKKYLPYILIGVAIIVFAR